MQHPHLHPCYCFHSLHSLRSRHSLQNFNSTTATKKPALTTATGFNTLVGHTTIRNTNRGTISSGTFWYPFRWPTWRQRRVEWVGGVHEGGGAPPPFLPSVWGAATAPCRPPRPSGCCTVNQGCFRGAGGGVNGRPARGARGGTGRTERRPRKTWRFRSSRRCLFWRSSVFGR